LVTILSFGAHKPYAYHVAAPWVFDWRFPLHCSYSSDGVIGGNRAGEYPRAAKMHWNFEQSIEFHTKHLLKYHFNFSPILRTNQINNDFGNFASEKIV